MLLLTNGSRKMVELTMALAMQMWAEECDVPVATSVMRTRGQR